MNNDMEMVGLVTGIFKQIKKSGRPIVVADGKYKLLFNVIRNGAPLYNNIPVITRHNIADVVTSDSVLRDINTSTPGRATVTDLVRYLRSIEDSYTSAISKERDPYGYIVNNPNKRLHCGIIISPTIREQSIWYKYELIPEVSVKIKSDIDF